MKCKMVCVSPPPAGRVGHVGQQRQVLAAGAALAVEQEVLGQPPPPLGPRHAGGARVVVVGDLLARADGPGRDTRHAGSVIHLHYS